MTAKADAHLVRFPSSIIRAPTHELLLGTPAIDSGNPTPVGMLDFDQRGAPFERVQSGTIDVGAFEVQITPPLTCDFSGDGVCDGTDIDMLQENIVVGPADPLAFDLTGDGLVTLEDRDEWLILAGAANLPSGNAYLLGDANLDGTVNELRQLVYFAATTA